MPGQPRKSLSRQVVGGGGNQGKMDLSPAKAEAKASADARDDDCRAAFFAPESHKKTVNWR